MHSVVGLEQALLYDIDISLTEPDSNSQTFPSLAIHAVKAPAQLSVAGHCEW